jgi:peroxiredoxin
MNTSISLQEIIMSNSSDKKKYIMLLFPWLQTKLCQSTVKLKVSDKHKKKKRNDWKMCEKDLLINNFIIGLMFCIFWMFIEYSI